MLPQKKSQLRRNAWYRQQLLHNVSAGLAVGPDPENEHCSTDRSRIAENSHAVFETTRTTRVEFYCEFSNGDQA